MGMNADVLAIGPFSEDIMGMLDYPPKYYKGVKPGTTVITTVFSCNTSAASNELAGVLGIDPWDFGTHEINSKSVDAAALVEWLKNGGWAENKLEDVETFFTLTKKGFIFFFRPNG